MSRINDLLQELESYIESAEKKVEIAGIVPKYSLGQTVWILKGEIPSWYDFPILTGKEKCEDCFEEEEIEKIIISKLYDSGTKGCRVQSINPVVVTYEFNRYMYYDKFFLEKDVYLTLEEAVNQNESAFEKDMQRWINEKKREKEEKKKHLEKELKEL